MKKTLLLSKFQTLFLKEKKRYLFALGVFVMGIFLGLLSALTSKADSLMDAKAYFDRFFSAYSLQGTVKSDAFSLALLNYLTLFGGIWLSGWFIWLLPMGILQVLLKGFRTGFTITYLLKCYSFKGILLSVLCILPQNLILLPTLCIFLVSAIQFAIDRRQILKRTVSDSVKWQIYKHYFAISGILLILFLLCALVESYVVPTLLQPFCNFFW